MKAILVFLLFAVQTSFGQEITTKLLGKNLLKAEKYVGTDDYGSHYYLQGNVFYKASTEKLFQFSDLQLGKPTNVDIINPLKITLFYEQVNTLVFLDRHLVEINRIHFNTLPDLRNIKFATTAGNDKLWIFNLGTKQLEIFDYPLKKTLAETQPVSSEVLDQKSNFNFCWLLTENTLEKYNLYGSLLKKIPNQDFVRLAENNERLIAQKEDNLYLWDKKSNGFKTLNLPKIDLKDFYLNDEKLYLYDGKMLYEFKIQALE